IATVRLAGVLGVESVGRVTVIVSTSTSVRHCHPVALDQRPGGLPLSFGLPRATRLAVVPCSSATAVRAHGGALRGHGRSARQHQDRRASFPFPFSSRVTTPFARTRARFPTSS